MKHYNHISFLLLLVSFLSVAGLSPCMAVSPQKAKAKVVAKRPVSKTVKKRPASSLSPAQTLIRKAQSGDAEAQYELGNNYLYGWNNFPKDEGKAIMWWKKAAAQNHAEACSQLSFRLENEEERLFYARKGASLGDPECYMKLGRIYEEKEEYKHLAGAMYLKAVELGLNSDYGISAALGMAYQYGKLGLPKDKSKALFWYKKYCDYLYSDYLEEGDTDSYGYVQYWLKRTKEEFNCDYDPALHVDEYKRWLKERTKPSDGGSAPRSSVASSVSSGTVKYHYTKSGRGQSQNTGQWTDSSGAEECEVEFGDDGITINGVYYEYLRTSGNWKIYRGLSMSYGGSSNTSYYYVDANKNMKMVCETTGPGISDTYIYPMSRNREPTPQGSGVTSGRSYGSGNSVSGGSVNKSLEERKRDVLNSGGGYNCGLCKGTGKCFNCKGTGVANYMGTTKKCVSCKDAPGVCSQCHGTKVSSWNR